MELRRLHLRWMAATILISAAAFAVAAWFAPDRPDPDRVTSGGRAWKYMGPPSRPAAARLVERTPVAEIGGRPEADALPFPPITPSASRMEPVRPIPSEQRKSAPNLGRNKPAVGAATPMP